MRHLAVALVFMLAVFTAPTAHAQLFGDRTQANCASVTRGSVESSTITVICGMPPEQVVEMVRLAASPNTADHDILIAHLNALLPADSHFSAGAVARFLQILHEQPVEPTKLADRFAQIAEEHVRLLAEVRAFRVNDPEVQALRDAAAVALQGVPNHDLARAKLEEARQLVRSKRHAVAKVLADEQREEATLVREQARVELSRWRLTEAARLYEQAAGLLPTEDHNQRGDDLVSACLFWGSQGLSGDSQALSTAVTDCRAALGENTRDNVPLQWARTQTALGLALEKLAELENNTELLNQAITAYRAALEEHTHDRVPCKWAMSQQNLGRALAMLGERENSTDHFIQAAAAYRAALEEVSRHIADKDCEGLDRATTLTQLGRALATLGRLESSTDHLIEAVTAYRIALGEETSNISSDRGWIQLNLGIALAMLGEFESGTRRLDEAITVLRAAREENTRDRAPLDWAAAQMTLGLVLETLSERKNSDALLREAIMCMQGAAEEFENADETDWLWKAQRYIAEMNAALSQMRAPNEGAQYLE